MKIKQLITGTSALIAVGVLMGGTQANAAAFELEKECKPSPPYHAKDFVGQCNNQGLLHGEAIVRTPYDDGKSSYLTIRGNFTNGLPNGDMQVFGSDAPLNFIQTIDVAKERYQVCSINFVNGKLDNNKTMVCNRKGGGRFNKIFFSITPSIGGFDWDGQKELFVTANLPKIEYKNKDYHFLGEATTFKISRNPLMNTESAIGTKTKIDTTQKMQGVFNIGGCSFAADGPLRPASCEIIAKTLDRWTFNRAVDKDYLYIYSYTSNGKTHQIQLVFLEENRKVRYYKDDTGLEFDGTKVEDGYADITGLFSDQEIKIRPNNGTITDPTGRTANFKNYKPIN